MRKIYSLFIVLLISNTIYGQCPTLLPTGHDTCKFGAGSVELRASLSSTGLYSWYDSSVGGSFLGSGEFFTTPSVASTTSFFVASSAKNKGIEFDGANDYIAIDNFTYTGTGHTAVTVEAWIKTTDGTDQMICSFDRSEFWRLSINGDGAGTGQVSWCIRTNAGQLDMGSTSRVDDGEWHHVAAVFDNGVSSIYIDGLLDAQQTRGTTFGRAVTRFGFVSAGSEATSFNNTRTPFWPFNGSLDDIRIWNVAKSELDIQTSMNTCLDGTEPGLDLLYDFEGTTSTVNDLVSNNDGTMFNMDVATDRVIVDRNYSCLSCEGPRAEVIANINNSATLDLGTGSLISCSAGPQTIDAGPGFSNYLWSTGESSQIINTSSGGEYTVVVDDGLGCFDYDTISFAETGGSARTSLNFDGGNDYASIAGFSYGSSTLREVTVESWIKTSNGGNQIIASFDRSDYWRLGMNGNGAGTGQVSWCVMTNSGQLDMGSTRRVDDGNWHHVVGVYDNGVASIYIDGVLDNQTTRGTTFGIGSTRFGFVGTGSEASTVNGTRGPNDEFNGDIDELRIWSVAKSESEIRDMMCRTFTGVIDGLEVYYTFNNGTGSSVITDVANGNNATLRSMSPATDWVTSGAAVGDNSVYLYPGSWGGQLVSLTSCDGDEVELSNVSGTIGGVHLYVVESDPANQSDLLVLTNGNHYYGVFQTGSGTETYDFTNTYTNHPLVTTTNEVSLYLADRTDNSTSPWIDNSAVLDEDNDNLTVNLTGRKEVILDSKEFVWTGLVNTDWNTGGNWLPTSVPPVNASIRIPDVPNQPILDMARSISALNIEALATVDLNGFELSLTRDLLLDGEVISNEGTLTFNGADKTQFLTLNNPLDIDNLTIDNPQNVTTQTGSINLSNTLTVSQGSFETNSELTILSTPTRTGRIAEITGDGVTGDITMERLIGAGETYWRFFSSAVQGVTIGDYQDDFVTAGYPGSAFPNFGWVSIYNYDETQGTGLGYTPVTGSSQALNPGEGFMVWSGDTITFTNAFTVDLKGVPNQGNVPMPVSFTGTGNANEDGWNLVGNPYASTIDWDSPNWVRSDMANAIQILNPQTGEYATYVNGAALMGGSRFIASQQAFWVYAENINGTLTATEGIKASVDQAFLRSNSISPGLKISVNGFGKRDECIIRHVENASESFDSDFDAYKLYSGSGIYPYISLYNSYNENLSVHSFDKANTEWAIPLSVIVYENGVYQLDFESVQELDVPCLKLEDTYTSEFYDISDGNSISVELSDTTLLPRFVIHVGRDYESNVIGTTCFENNDGKIELDLDSTFPMDYNVTYNSNVTTQTGNVNPLILNDLAAGTYQIEIPDLQNTCNTSNFAFVVPSTSPVQATESISDGSIELNVIGGTPPYQFAWSNGAVTSNIDNLEAGTYFVEITDANGCSFTSSYSVENTLSVNSNSMSTELQAYYTSTTNEIVINNLDLAEDKEIRIIGVNGALIESYIISNNVTSSTHKLQHKLTKGVYMLWINETAIKFVN